MRIELKALNGRRCRYRAEVVKFGIKHNYRDYPTQTILLTDVQFAESDIMATDHLWFTVGATLSRLMLAPGDKIEFDARVGIYEKGYINPRKYINERETDYKLKRPSRIVKL